ncbi:hypothetical protein [Streptomyces axinellae]|uniref:Integral membrane protein n=1 Tax=Streptomyces axinellae TaxID=552788 RepID=A0ABP6CAW2_9ACTN
MDASDSTATPGALRALDGDDDSNERLPHRRTPSQWAGLALLAVAVLVFGAFVLVFGPLLAISCTDSDCLGGVRGPLLFGEALLAVAWYGVPLTTLGTLVAMFGMRRGARAGGIGLCALLLLLLLEQFLGQFTG